jgi:mono/diheme cytochrome c family protein
MRRFLVVILLALVAVAATACGGGAASAPKSKGDAVKGKTVFASTCSACHGPDGKGVPSLGKDLTSSTFVKGMNDDQFLDFLKKGRPATDPANTTKVDMPPKGGNASFTDQDLYDVIAYVRSLVK